MMEDEGTNGKLVLKPIIYFQTWRIGKLYLHCSNFKKKILLVQHVA